MDTVYMKKDLIMCVLAKGTHIAFRFYQYCEQRALIIHSLQQHFSNS